MAKSMMLKHMQNLAIAWVWWPLAVLGSWLGTAILVAAVLSKDIAAGLLLLVILTTFLLSHALAFAALIGAGLLLTGRAERKWMTLGSALVGGAVAATVLYYFYFQFDIDAGGF
jgi:hypothetical protein